MGIFDRTGTGWTPALQAARDAWYNCHAWTHSIWYAAALFEDKLTLYLDGDTDGGCWTIDSVPQIDLLEMCPSYTKADHDCSAVADTVLAMPVTQMGIVAGSLLGLIYLLFCLGYTIMQRAVMQGAWHFTGRKK